jgi:ubiquinone/menaquinone biosynthesis C-methylase UbiE
VARALVDTYALASDAAILDVGCGKAFLLYELTQLLPAARVVGLDASPYALANAKEEVRGRVQLHRAEAPLPFAAGEFDLVISLTTLHNLELFHLEPALREIERVGTQKYVVVESYRNEAELFNLQCWALTCESFFTPGGWLWLFDHSGYTGDYEFIFFE